MRVIDHIRNSAGSTAFSFEILPPLKGNDIERVYAIVDKLREFDPKYINITSHRSEIEYRENPDGTIVKNKVKKRPGTVAIASAVQNKYGITAVPHIICKGFTRDETEYALIDLNFLGIHDLLLLQGDAKGPDKSTDPRVVNLHASDLQAQVNDFNRGLYHDGLRFEPNATPFSYGMACYPEKHEAAPNMESDLRHAKAKVDAGADYLVTQMFFDNEKYYSFVERARAAGITVPIIPGIKPVVTRSQLTVLPRVFRSDIPEPFAAELRKCATDEQAREVGVEWCIAQCRDLMAHGVPSIHFYTLMATDSVRRIAREIY
ncbi:MAG: methylenetetrahydrofolate reductase [NAD(P)H] [Duncaniella sp.]|nr:methylenetetrahydrofolate reductase [NAD(P)H] [Duncaniella sp.]MDE5751228.1 methylenetetrahydrofolate reductase [NAD(P)H] [Duncaniella sp.]MDE6328006.1 methylenetetrahydrofolate reductase [NAD(P)H] [Duncaniella sp.]MDE6359379.1 methylenetetrahydrofolate reductase [NAD(P)H] [Duncaniella sp.]MDE6571965.1 methylenetetrahydrofolate reductase [NAD(P)H] [Duncaniella sp.]